MVSHLEPKVIFMLPVVAVSLVVCRECVWHGHRILVTLFIGIYS